MQLFYIFAPMNFKFPTFLEGAMAPKVGKTAKCIRMMMRALFTAHQIPLTKEQFIVLICLQEEPQPQSALALITERDKGSLTRLVQSLEKKNYVKRTVSNTDARVNQVALTKHGKEIIKQTKPLMLKFVQSLQQGIDPAEMEIASKVLTQIQNNALDQLNKLEQHKPTS